jgi:glycosyltransferase involved in cell wall biosynthesis
VAKILFHTLVFPPDAITNAYILSDLARELHHTYGHEIRVLTTTPHYNLVDGDLGRQPLLPERGRWLLRSDFAGMICLHIRVPSVKGGVGMRLITAFRFHFLGLLAVLRMHWSCDVVISQSPPLSIGLIGSWMALLLGAKSIYIVQDIFPDGLIRQGKIRNSILIAALRILERWVYSSNHAVCGISEGFIRDLRPRVPRNRLLEIIPNFVNTDVYRPLPRDNEYARAHGLAKRLVVSYVGNVGNAQDFGPVFVAAQACADLPITFLIVGDGIRRQSLEEDARRRGLINLLFLGYQPREDTPWINASSDLTLILLAPHVGNHGFPSKVYTLMASARPIVLVGDPESDIAGLIRSTETGWVVPCGDDEGFSALVRRLYCERDTLTEYGERGLKVVEERFTVACVARKYNDLIARLTKA